MFLSCLSLGGRALGGALAGRNTLISVYFRPHLVREHTGVHGISGELQRLGASSVPRGGTLDFQVAIVYSIVEPQWKHSSGEPFQRLNATK